MPLGVKVGFKGDKGLWLVASVLDIAVSVPSTCSNCWPNPSLLHTTNLGPRPETTVVSSTVRHSSNNYIITVRDYSALSLRANISMEHLSTSLHVLSHTSPRWPGGGSANYIFTQISTYICWWMDGLIVNSFRALAPAGVEYLTPSRTGSCFIERAEHWWQDRVHKYL